MIVFGPHDTLGKWLCERIQYVPTPNLRCMGNVARDGTIRGVVGFDDWNGASCQMHVAGEGYWVTRDFLRHVFAYVFDTAGLNMVIGVVPSGNTRALRFDKHVGFKVVATLEGAHPDGSLVIVSLKREDCRYLERKDGQEINSRAA